MPRHVPSPRVRIGRERMVLADGLQPFLFRSSRGTMFLQAQLTAPPSFVPAKQNVIPGDGIAGNVISRDGGRTWSRWMPDEWRVRRPFFGGAFAELSDGTIMLIEWIATPTKRRGVLTARLWLSHDDLRTFRSLRATLHLPHARTDGFDDGGRPYSGVTFHRTLLEMLNGDLLAAIYCWFKGDNTPCPYQPKMKKFRCVLVRSTDRGRNWAYVSTIAADPRIGEEGFNESAMVRLSCGKHAGRLICLIRTGCFNCPLYQVTSDDDGATWSRPRPTTMRGVDPDLIELADGTLVCSFGRRTKDCGSRRPSQANGNYVAVSTDQGRTWRSVTRIPIDPHANTPWTTAYTTVREQAPGELFLVYDVGRWGQPVRYTACRNLTLR